jgi:hypothetical protein
MRRSGSSTGNECKALTTYNIRKERPMISIKLKIDEDTILIAYAEDFSMETSWKILKQIMKSEGLSSMIPDALFGLTLLGKIEFNGLTVKVRPL